MSRIAAAMALSASLDGADAPASTERKQFAVTVLDAVIGACGIPRKELAALLGMRESHFNRVARGEQGDILGLVDRLPEAMREDFWQRFTATTDVTDPFAQVVDQINAAEQLDRAAVLWLRLRGHALQAVKASVR